MLFPITVSNFIVRPKRRLVDVYSGFDAWATLTDAERAELAHELAGLPTELPSEEEERSDSTC